MRSALQIDVEQKDDYIYMLTPPEAFGCVEDGIYRCSALDPLNLQFLSTLGLGIIISLNPEKPSKPVRSFAQENMIQLVHLGLRPWRPVIDNWMLFSKELIQDALTYILDRGKQPVLILDSTNAFVGVLRNLQHWNYSSVVAEYRAFSGGKSHYMTEIFLELLDMKCIPHEQAIKEKESKLPLSRNETQIIIALPPEEVLPDWFQRQRELWQKELDNES